MYIDNIHLDIPWAHCLMVSMQTFSFNLQACPSPANARVELLSTPEGLLLVSSDLQSAYTLSHSLNTVGCDHDLPKTASCQPCLHSKFQAYIVRPCLKTLKKKINNNKNIFMAKRDMLLCWFLYDWFYVNFTQARVIREMGTSVIPGWGQPVAHFLN